MYDTQLVSTPEARIAECKGPEHIVSVGPYDIALIIREIGSEPRPSLGSTLDLRRYLFSIWLPLTA